MKEGNEQTLGQKAIEFIKSIFWRRREAIREDTIQNIDDILSQDWSAEKQEMNKEKPSSQTWEVAETHFEERDEYTPQDIEFWEALGEEKRFAEIFRWIKGYHVSGRMSYFNKKTNTWSKKKKFQPFSAKIDTTKISSTYAGVIPTGVIAIPLPYKSLPDISTLQTSWKNSPVFFQDQNWVLYVTSYEKQYISFRFFQDQKQDIWTPIREDSENIIHAKLSDATESFIAKLPTGDIWNAEKIKKYIISQKKYSEKVQWELHRKSDTSNYLVHLDASPILECFSANTLFVGLCRKMWLAARIVVGHMVQRLDTNGKWLLGSGNGHAWSEVWNEQTQSWELFDATPIVKENGEKSEQNGQESGESEGQDGDMSWNSGESEGSEAWEWSWDQEWKENENWDENSWENKDSWSESQEKDEDPTSWERWETQEQKSPSEMLDELIENVKKDNLTQQAEKLQEEKEKLENAQSKEEMRDILDNSELSDFAKEELKEEWNKKILEKEKEALQKAKDENEIDSSLQDSLLDEEYKKKLEAYGKELKKKMEEERKREQTEMDRMGFTKQELSLYKLYKELEQEIAPEVKRQIRALEKILPPYYKLSRNEEEYFLSGWNLGGTGKLIEHVLTGDPKVFQREKESKENVEINMFETILIDKSGSMWTIWDTFSPLREAVKAAIIRAKVLEHFKVQFSIILFDDSMDEVMSFGEKFTDKRKNTVPSRLMRGLIYQSGTNISAPMSYTLTSMKDFSKKTGKKSYGNISFLGDGAPQSGLQWTALKILIDEIRRQGFGLTAYYINGSEQHRQTLEQYFGKEESWGTVIVRDVTELSEKLIGSYNTGLKKILKKYTTL